MVFYPVSELLKSARTRKIRLRKCIRDIVCDRSRQLAHSRAHWTGGILNAQSTESMTTTDSHFCIFIFFLFSLFSFASARASAMLWFTFWHRFCAFVFLELCAFVLTLWRRHIFQFCTSIGTQLHIRRNTHIEQLHALHSHSRLHTLPRSIETWNSIRIYSSESNAERDLRDSRLMVTNRGNYTIQMKCVFGRVESRGAPIERARKKKLSHKKSARRRKKEISCVFECRWRGHRSLALFRSILFTFRCGEIICRIGCRFICTHLLYLSFGTPCM